jgi:hypothetical protein
LQLWSNYGNLAEIWFDGGFAVGGLQDRLLPLLNATQRHASVFNGCGLSPNAVAWIGTESGHAPYPLWNTQTGCPSGAGTVDGSAFVPKEVDLTLQHSDTWFYREGTGYRSLAEMVDIYHDSVGVGANMLLNVAPPMNASLPQTAMDTYAQLGAFTRSCYGEGGMASATALASTPAGQGCRGCSSVVLDVRGKAGRPVAMDRFLIKEEMSGGQLVTAFEVLVDGKAVFTGSSIGRSLVVLLGKTKASGASVVATGPVRGSKVELRVTAARSTPSFRLFAVPDPVSCQVGDGPDGCSLLQNTLYQGPALPGWPRAVASVGACCAACKTEPTCALFTAIPAAASASASCSLLSAQTGSTEQNGAISGSPKR